MAEQDLTADEIAAALLAPNATGRNAINRWRIARFLARAMANEHRTMPPEPVEGLAAHIERVK